MKLAIVGSGYVAVVTAVCLAGMGHQVVYANPDAVEAERLQNGQLSFYEEGLEARLNTELTQGNLVVGSDVAAAVQQASVVFLSVAVPTLPDGKPDLAPMHHALELIQQGLQHSTGYKLLVERSTLPLTTAQWLQSQLQQFVASSASPVRVDVAVLPQFLREGSAVKDFYKPDRIVIGAGSQQAIDTLVTLFSSLHAPILITDLTSAELIKHATNAFLAMKISFINSLGQLCEKVQADVALVAQGLGMDRRISPEFLQAGIGYGGIFLPRDVASLIHVAEQHHLSLDLLKATDVINRYQRISFMERLVDALGGNLSGKTIAVWGLAYRPDTDDMRDAPSTQIIWGLQNRGASIRAYDPLAMEKAREKVRRVSFCESPYQAAEGADAIAILTEWPEFQQINFRRLLEVSPCRVVVDGRNLYSPQRMRELGFRYYPVGRPALEPLAPPPEPLPAR